MTVSCGMKTALDVMNSSQVRSPSLTMLCEVLKLAVGFIVIMLFCWARVNSSSVEESWQKSFCIPFIVKYHSLTHSSFLSLWIAYLDGRNG